jgi:hypothetical protein
MRHHCIPTTYSNTESCVVTPALLRTQVSRRSTRGGENMGACCGRPSGATCSQLAAAGLLLSAADWALLRGRGVTGAGRAAAVLALGDEGLGCARRPAPCSCVRRLRTRVASTAPAGGCRVPTFDSRDLRFTMAKVYVVTFQHSARITVGRDNKGPWTTGVGPVLAMGRQGSRFIYRFSIQKLHRISLRNGCILNP